MGFGVVVRDSHGNLLAARCAIRTGYLAPASAEAMADGLFKSPFGR
jgi:hypothetical protein